MHALILLFAAVFGRFSLSNTCFGMNKKGDPRFSCCAYMRF